MKRIHSTLIIGVRISHVLEVKLICSGGHDFVGILRTGEKSKLILDFSLPPIRLPHVNLPSSSSVWQDTFSAEHG